MPGSLFDKIDAEIHLQEGKALLGHALLQTVGENFRVVRFRGVCVAADLVAEFSAKHLIRRHVIDFAGDIPQRHLHAADTAALSRMSAELFDFAEDLVDIAGIFVRGSARFNINA